MLEFLLALKHCNGHNLRLFELGAQMAPCLNALPLRLGQGIDRFGYKLLTQLLRELQASKGEECAEAVNQYACEMMDRAGATTFLILIERDIEQCCPGFAPRDSSSSGVSLHYNASWSGLSAWLMGSLLTEAAQVLETHQRRGYEAPPSSLDRLIALKWLHANSATITVEFQEPYDLITLLTNVASSDAASTSVVQRLAAELVEIEVTQTTVLETAIGSEIGPRYELSMMTLESLLKMPNERSDEHKRAIQCLMSSNEGFTIGTLSYFQRGPMGTAGSYDH